VVIVSLGFSNRFSNTGPGVFEEKMAVFFNLTCIHCTHTINHAHTVKLEGPKLCREKHSADCAKTTPREWAKPILSGRFWYGRLETILSAEFVGGGCQKYTLWLFFSSNLKCLSPSYVNLAKTKTNNNNWPEESILGLFSHYFCLCIQSGRDLSEVFIPYTRLTLYTIFGRTSRSQEGRVILRS